MIVYSFGKKHQLVRPCMSRQREKKVTPRTNGIHEKLSFYSLQRGNKKISYQSASPLIIIFQLSCHRAQVRDKAPSLNAFYSRLYERLLCTLFNPLTLFLHDSIVSLTLS